MGVEVRTFEQAPEAWRHYADGSASACIYHDARWKTVIEETYGHICHYLIAFRSDRPAGILPLVEIRSRWFGHFMVSLPFVTYGGITAEDDSAATALAEEAARRCREAGGRWVELRQRDNAGLRWPSRHHKVALATDVSNGAEALWTRLSSRLRGKIRKAERSGASFEVAGAEGAGEFYRIFARNMRDLGTPVYPLRFFQSIAGHFSGQTRLFLVRKSGRVVAAAFGLEDRRLLQLPWICSDYRYSGNYANEFLYWSVLEWAANHGFRKVDFGRSTAGSGNHRFKKQWNPEETPLTWYYWTPEGCSPPRLDPESPRFRLAIRLWRRLPLAVANFLGPRIVRCLP